MRVRHVIRSNRATEHGPLRPRLGVVIETIKPLRSVFSNGFSARTGLKRIPTREIGVVAGWASVRRYIAIVIRPTGPDSRFRFRIAEADDVGGSEFPD